MNLSVALENPFERLPPQPFPSYAANGKFLLHSRPSQPICPLLTCISQSAQSLSSRTVSPYSSTGFFEITAPTESHFAGHGRHQSNHGAERDNKSALLLLFLCQP